MMGGASPLIFFLCCVGIFLKSIKPFIHWHQIKELSSKPQTMNAEHELIIALVQALKDTNRFIEPFIFESAELSAQLSENEELIQMVEPDIDNFNF